MSTDHIEPGVKEPEVGDEEDEFDELDGTHPSPEYCTHDFTIPCV